MKTMPPHDDHYRETQERLGELVEMGIVEIDGKDALGRTVYRLASPEQVHRIAEIIDKAGIGSISPRQAVRLAKRKK
jgi:hypothetical protein